MTELEKIQKRIILITDAIDIVRDCANQERKLLHEKTVNGHYTKALHELEAIKSHAENMLTRIKTVE